MIPALDPQTVSTGQTAAHLLVHDAMKSRLFTLFVAALLCCQPAFGGQAKRPVSDHRLAFLMGMTSFSGRGGLSPVFPPENETFLRVARLYAEDLGLPPAALAREAEWKSYVEDKIAQQFREGRWVPSIEEIFGSAAEGDHDLRFSYLAGAYAGFGRPDGFGLTNQFKGLYLLKVMGECYNAVMDIEVKMASGRAPGGIRITLRDVDKPTVADFLKGLDETRKQLEIRK